MDKENFHQIFEIEFKDKSKEKVINAVKELEKIDGTLWAGPNSDCDYTISALPSASSGTRYPNLWGLHGTYGIKAEQAWDITTGIRNNVRVGVMDTGIANHPDLNANLVAGWDFMNNTPFRFLPQCAFCFKWSI